MADPGNLLQAGEGEVVFGARLSVELGELVEVVPQQLRHDEQVLLQVPPTPRTYETDHSVHRSDMGGYLIDHRTLGGYQHLLKPTAMQGTRIRNDMNATWKRADGEP